MGVTISQNICTNTQQHLTWQDAENQRRIEEMQEPNSWWGDSGSTEVEPSSFGYHGKRASAITEMSCGATHFDGGYVEVGNSFFFHPFLYFILTFFFLVWILRLASRYKSTC